MVNNPASYSADYYQAIIEDLHATLNALDTSAYQGDSSDRWTQALAAEGATSHLETWVDLGQMVEFNRGDIDHDAALIVAMRYAPDDDALSQARIHSAARHASETLRTWEPSDGVGALPTGYTLAFPNSEWAVVTISFTLTLLRG